MGGRASPWKGHAHVFPVPMWSVAPADPSRSSEGWGRWAKRALNLDTGSLGLGPGPGDRSVTAGQRDRAWKHRGHSLWRGGGSADEVARCRLRWNKLMFAVGVSRTLASPRSAESIWGHLSFLVEIFELSLTRKCTCLHGDILFLFLSM